MGQVGHTCFWVKGFPRGINPASIQSLLDKIPNTLVVRPSEFGARKTKVQHIATIHAFPVFSNSLNAYGISPKFFIFINHFIEISHKNPWQVMVFRDLFQISPQKTSIFIFRTSIHNTKNLGER